MRAQIWGVLPPSAEVSSIGALGQRWVRVPWADRRTPCRHSTSCRFASQEIDSATGSPRNYSMFTKNRSSFGRAWICVRTYPFPLFPACNGSNRHIRISSLRFPHFCISVFLLCDFCVNNAYHATAKCSDRVRCLRASSIRTLPGLLQSLRHQPVTQPDALLAHSHDRVGD